MKFEITYVPKDKKILEFLKEMKTRFPKSWFIVHINVLMSLSNNENCSTSSSMYGANIDWRLLSRIEKHHATKKIEYINFCTCNNPENVFFIDIEN